MQKIKEFQDDDRCRLLLPEQLEIEVARHRPGALDGALERQKTSMQTYLQHARKLFQELLPGPQSDELLSHAELKLSDWRASTDQVVMLFDQILSHKSIIHIKTSSDILIRAIKRCLSSLAPAHSKHNASADAVLLESILEHKRTDPATPLFFVTHNKRDFSDPNDPKKPHPHFVREFENNQISYHLSLADALEEIGNIQIPAEIKEKEVEMGYGGFVTLSTDHAPDYCVRCQGALLHRGYRNLAGFAGDVYSCLQCGTTLHWLDHDNY